MLTIQLDDKTETRLNNLAETTGRTTTWYASKAIETYLDDLEDAAIATSAYEEYLRDGKKSSSLEEVRHRLSDSK